MRYIMQFVAWIDRNWCLLFRKHICLEMSTTDPALGYNEVIEFANNIKARYLGNDWYIRVSIRFMIGDMIETRWHEVGYVKTACTRNRYIIMFVGREAVVHSDDLNPIPASDVAKAVNTSQS